MAKNYLTTLFMLMCANCFMINAMENTSGSQVHPDLFVRNASNWDISVFWRTADKRDFNIVVHAHSFEKLDALENINKLEIQTYIKYLSYFARKHKIALPTINRNLSHFDEYIHVDGSYYLPWLWAVRYIQRLRA